MEKEELQKEELQKEEQVLITDIAEAEREKQRQKEQEQKKAEIRAKKRKLIPPFLMLLAGAIVSITMFLLHYKAQDMLTILLCVLIVFYIAGELIKWMFDRFEAQIAEANMEKEGEVIEKELSEEDIAASEKAAQKIKTEIQDDDEELIF